MKQSFRIPIIKDVFDNPTYLIMLNQLFSQLEYIMPGINSGFGQVEPKAEYKRDGFLAFADGDLWKPNGSGTKGLWYWNATSSLWVQL